MIDIKESLPIVKYILDQINFPALFERYKFPIIIILGGLFLINILIRLYKWKTGPKENVYDPRCYEININGNQGAAKWQYEDLIRNLYTLLFREYKGKVHMTYEILIDQNGSKLFICFPNKIVAKLNNLLNNLNYITFSDRTKQRHKFLDNLDKNITGFTYELSDDYVFPLKLNQEVLPTSIKKGEYIFLQFNLRPINTRWMKNAKRYKKLLQKGRNPSLSESLLGGCFSVVLPFLSFFADIMTGLVHGSKAKTEAVQNLGVNSKNKRLDIIEEKISRYGFEFFGRGILRTLEKDKKYAFLDYIQENFEIKEDAYNQLIFSDIKKKFKKSDKVDFEYLFMSKDAIDILNEKEISILLKSFL